MKRKKEKITSQTGILLAKLGVSPWRVEQRGITLIALVITVIVLLILAGAAVSIGLNGDDVFGRANQAKTGWNDKVAEEDQKLGEVWSILNSIDSNGNITGTPTPTPNGDLPAGWYAPAVASVYPNKDATQKAPIPKGFTVSSVNTENSITNGLVIYEGTEAVTDENHETAMTTRNQYVWIPVGDINDMVMCKSRTDESECNIGFVDGVLKCKNSNHSATATNLCGRLYSDNIDWNNPTVTDEKRIYSGAMSASKAEQTWDTSGNHEPDLVTKDEDTENARNQITSDFYSMAESVATYGGFYIARYEAQADAGSKKNQSVITAGTNSQMWYGLYGTLRKQIKNEGTTTLVGQMIWGSQYDQVIKFIGSDAQTGHLYQGASPANSGANTNDKLKNIYDLEGNISELTAEANSSSERRFRGGDYIDASEGYYKPASYEGYIGPIYTNDHDSSRQSLYVALKAGSDTLEGAQYMAKDPNAICCFDPDSQVLMADGTTKNIEDVHIGDMVMSLNEETGEYVEQRIINHVTKHNSDDLVYVNLSNGEKIGMRAYHPLLTTDGWKSLRPEEAEITMGEGETVGTLQVGDTLIGKDGNVTIVSIEQRAPIENYNTHLIETEELHNHVLNGVVVHSAPRKDIYFKK